MTEVTRDPRPVINIRITPEEKQMLVQIAREDGYPQSVVLRQMLRADYDRRQRAKKRPP